MIKKFLQSIIVGTVFSMCVSAVVLADTATDYGSYGWKQDNNGWYYIYNGSILKGSWMKDTDGQWYYLSDEGYMHTGWLKDYDNKWYFLKPTNGASATGLATIDGQVYYFSPDSEPVGVMVTGNQVIDGTTYYFDPVSGAGTITSGESKETEQFSTANMGSSGSNSSATESNTISNTGYNDIDGYTYTSLHGDTYTDLQMGRIALDSLLYNLKHPESVKIDYMVAEDLDSYFGRHVHRHFRGVLIKYSALNNLGMRVSNYFFSCPSYLENRTGWMNYTDALESINASTFNAATKKFYLNHEALLAEHGIQNP